MIHFVGAGPGAVDLITVRGAELIKKADVIIYAGSLVNRELLDHAKKTTELYDSKDMDLQQIIEVMKRADENGLELVRLHTGEPSLYGAVREQMDELERMGIAYDSCPGVTAAFGAAAALDIEYTLPDISQSLIITRMEGRTGVPEGENIESFAAHKASMAIYLSAGMLKELSARLVNGGYSPDTPAAIVYKATWPDEKKIITSISGLSDAAEREGIKNHAVVLVGEAVGHEGYKRSKLYDSDFTTAYRKAHGAAVYENTDRKTADDKESVNNVRGRLVNRFPEADIFVFTDRAESLAGRVKDAMNELGSSDTAIFRCRMDEAKKRLGFCFEERRAAVFISAAGIAVRSIAGFVKDKLTDSPVIVISEDGKYVIPLLSGHMGGANGLAEAIADRLGAFRVITTATDISGGFQLDNYAKNHQLYIVDRNLIKIAAGKQPGISAENSIKEESADWKEDFIRQNIGNGGLKTRKYYLGIGCRRGKSYGDIKKAVEDFLLQNDIDKTRIAAVCSIDVKKDEEGIRRFANVERLPFVVYPAEMLNSLGDGFTASGKVMETVGVDNVCERAAVAAALEFAGEVRSDDVVTEEMPKDGVHPDDANKPEEPVILCGRRLVARKTVFEGITLALAEGSWCGRAIDQYAGKNDMDNNDIKETDTYSSAAEINEHDKSGRYSIDQNKKSLINIVGIGPGNVTMMTEEAAAAVKGSDTIVGYPVYLKLIEELTDGKKLISTPMKREVERCRMAFEEAEKGNTVAVVSSGDAGVYGMASLMYELLPEYPGVQLNVVAGITAANSGAAVLGAPLSGDFAVISMSDLLTPFEVIEKRLRLAAEADMVIVLYNPASHKRKDYLKKACDLISDVIPPDRACGYVKNIGREGQNAVVTTFDKLSSADVDMFTTVYIGNSMSYINDGRMITRRGYDTD